MTRQLNGDLRAEDLPGNLIALVQLDAIREGLRLLENFYQRRRHVESVGYNDGTVIGFGLHVENSQPVYVEDSPIAWQLEYDILIIVRPKRVHARRRDALSYVSR